MTPIKLIFKNFDIEDDFLLINFLDDGPLEEHVRLHNNREGGLAVVKPLSANSRDKTFKKKI